MRTKLKLLVLALLAFVAVAAALGNFKVAPGIDFYQYWGVVKAQQWSDRELKNPYAEPARYAAVLNAYAEASTDPRLKLANQHRRELELMQTPLCYAVFALFPADYSLAFGLFQVILLGLFLAAMVILGLDLRDQPLELLALALLLVLAYEPLSSDLRVGNLNSFQLFALAGLSWFAHRFLAAGRVSHSPGPGIVFMAGLTLLTFLKPNLALVTVSLALCLWARRGTAVFIRSALAALGLAVVLLALPCLQFHSWQVWQDWYRTINGYDGGLVSKGNYSAALLLAQFVGISVSKATVGLAEVLFISAVGAPATTAWLKTGLQGLQRAALRSLADPYLVTAAGVIATLALAPLVWFHYYVLTLFPAAWLLLARNFGVSARLAGGLAIFLTSGLAPRLFSAAPGPSSWAPYLVVLGLVPLWLGVLAAIAANLGSAEPESGTE